MDKRSDGGNFLRFAIGFELGMAAVALLIGRGVGVDPWREFDPTMRGLGLGVAATVPMAAVLLGFDLVPLRPLRRIRALIDELILPHLRGRLTLELALIAGAAGLGEETLFRGLIQAGLVGEIGPLGALVVASVVFGLLHALTIGYAVIAGLIGAYLGWLLLASGDLTVPVVAHGLYDLMALLYFLRTTAAGRIGQGDDRPEEDPTP